MKLTDMERDVRFSISPRRGSTSTISFDPSARDAIRLAVARWRRCVGMTVSPSFSSETTSSDLPTERQDFASTHFHSSHSQGLGGVPREQKMLKGHPLRVVNHQAYNVY